jgi:hypothetical protein
MTPGERNALKEAQRRLGHIEAIADLCSRQDDTELGEVVRGLAALIGDIGQSLEAVLDPVGGAA